MLNCRRDDFTDTVRRNLLAAYEFIDAVVDHDLDLFSDDGLEALLQLNHLVLLGRGYDPRAFRRHIAVTRRQFFDNFHRYVKPIRRWYRKHETENPYRSRRKSTWACLANHNSIRKAIIALDP